MGLPSNSCSEPKKEYCFPLPAASSPLRTLAAYKRRHADLHRNRCLARRSCAAAMHTPRLRRQPVSRWNAKRFRPPKGREYGWAANRCRYSLLSLSISLPAVAPTRVVRASDARSPQSCRRSADVVHFGVRPVAGLRTGARLLPARRRCRSYSIFAMRQASGPRPAQVGFRAAVSVCRSVSLLPPENLRRPGGSHYKHHLLARATPGLDLALRIYVRSSGEGVRDCRSMTIRRTSAVKPSSQCLRR